MPAARKVAFLTNVDRASEGQLGFLSVNGDAGLDSEAFRRSVPEGSRLAAALDEHLAGIDAGAGRDAAVSDEVARRLSDLGYT